MRTANEVIFVNAVNRADLNACLAAGAKRVINGCQVVFNLNSTVRASLLALHTANTAVGAKLASNRALIVVGALNNYLYGIVYKLNDVVGTFANAHAAANTFLRVNLCNAVLNRNSVLGAHACAVAITEASIVAGLIAVIQKVSGNTALKALIVVFSFGCAAVAVTSNV